jgi:hypothetical protein
MTTVPSVLQAMFHADALSIVDALRQRVRYRYVQPVVVPAEPGWKVVSPCCSRNVDADGGVIDIAWLEPVGEAWRLHARDHRQGRWRLQAEGPALAPLLELLCQDHRRVFWP